MIADTKRLHTGMYGVLFVPKTCSLIPYFCPPNIKLNVYVIIKRVSSTIDNTVCIDVTKKKKFKFFYFLDSISAICESFFN